MSENRDRINGRFESLPTLEELAQGVAEIIAIKVESIAGTKQRVMGIEDAATYLGMTPHSLRHKARVEIPCVDLDGRLRFDKRDLDMYIETAKRKGV